MTIQVCATHKLRFDDQEGGCLACEYPDEPEDGGCGCLAVHDEMETGGRCAACGGLVFGE